MLLYYSQTLNELFLEYLANIFRKCIILVELLNNSFYFEPIHKEYNIYNKIQRAIQEIDMPLK